MQLRRALQCLRLSINMKKSQEKVKKVMHEFKKGSLHSGSKQGPKVKSRKQAIAIALNQAGLSKQSR